MKKNKDIFSSVSFASNFFLTLKSTYFVYFLMLIIGMSHQSFAQMSVPENDKKAPTTRSLPSSLKNELSTEEQNNSNDTNNSKEKNKDQNNNYSNARSAVGASSNANTTPLLGENRQALGFGLGQTMLLGDFGKYGHNDLGIDLFYEYAASYSFSFLGNFHEQSFNGDQGQKTKLLGFDAQIKGKFFDYDAFAPFWTTGLGLYYPQITKLSGSSLKESQTNGTLGIVVGAGANLTLNERFSFALLSQLHLPFRIKQDSDQSFQGQYLKIMAALFIHF